MINQFYVINLGCKVNRVESDDFAAMLIAQGVSPAAVEDADLIIINTCAVTGEAEKKTRKAVRHALRANDYARVIVTGCAAALDADTYLALDERVQVVSKLEMHSLLRDITSETSSHDAAFTARSCSESEQASSGALFLHTASHDAASSDIPSCKISTPDVPSLPSTTHLRQHSAQDAQDLSWGQEHWEQEDSMRVGEEFPTRVGIKVQDGCNNACTYCIVHVARGRAWSRPSNQVISEAVRIAHAGAKEIVLTGINLGSYSFNGVGLTGLLQRLLNATDDVRFRVSSIEPCNVDDDLIELMAESNGRICRHLHLPLQSGSSKVLREMARPYRAEQYLLLVEKLYRAMPQLSLSTDVIVGFPGETEDDYRATEEVSRICRFSKMHIFRYSVREGTPAAKRSDQISPEVKADRAKRLEALSKRLASDDLARRAGTHELALVETGGVATTESYHTICAPPGARVGELLEVIL